jgi:NADPH:quinone reductase-like Zn-dependent oxidoreductase
MKAAIYTRYGSPDVLQLTDLEKPVPKANEVLIKVYATTVTSAETLLRVGKPYWGRIILGFTKPRRQILGMEFAGDIEAVGKDVTRFKIGEKVYGFSGFRLSANAEYLCMPESGSLGLKPTNLSYEKAAAAVDGASTALFFLKKLAKIQAGQKVLINGASGSIGTYAVQLAKYFAADVTAVCSGRNAELVKSLGADKVIDYGEEDFTQNTARYDIIFDTIGKSSFAQCKKVLSTNGVYLSTTGLINHLLMLWTSFRSGKKVAAGFSIEKNEALVFLKELIETDTLNVVIDKSYRLDEIAEAHRYVDTGRKKGNVVIIIA